MDTLSKQPTPRELPELPEPLVMQRMVRQLDDGASLFETTEVLMHFTAAQMHAYARQAIAESEAMAEGLRKALRGALVLLQIPESDIDSVIDAAIAQEAGRG